MWGRWPCDQICRGWRVGAEIGTMSLKDAKDFREPQSLGGRFSSEAFRGRLVTLWTPGF